MLSPSIYMRPFTEFTLSGIEGFRETTICKELLDALNQLSLLQVYGFLFFCSALTLFLCLRLANPLILPD